MKIIKRLVAFIACLTLVLSFTGCNKHEHLFTERYEGDKYIHYYTCACGEKTEVAEHVGGKATKKARAICEICNREYGDYLSSVGLEFELNQKGTEYSVLSIGTCTDTELVIPSQVDGIPVTQIGERAFYGTKIKTVIIPDSVKVIGEEAFCRANDLTKVTMVDGGVERVCRWAFQNCAKLTTVIFSNNIKVLEESSFYFCTKITSLTFPDSLEKIGNTAFFNLNTMTSVVFGRGIKEIGEESFAQCTKLTSVTYYGSPESWAKIKKGWNWNKWVSAKTVKCVYDDVALV